MCVCFFFCMKADQVDAEQGQVNLGIMAGERRAALAKVAELSEQKRVLVSPHFVLSFKKTIFRMMWNSYRQ